MGSVERAAENESTFREVNEDLEERAGELELGNERTPYLCECHDENCTRVVLLNRDEYERVRGAPHTFVLTPGHQSPDDRVVREDARYVVVEKTGEQARLVEQRNPRG